ncbi:MAG: group II truncated hemoglobin [Rhodobacteraceae bacterium]|nr:group II truncated hemoglobin [Paracoccaceae bacterium]PHR54770.1 MAG: cyanoglobin [Robiginitomaculum sp.]
MVSMIEHIGGEAGLRALVETFYDEVESNPAGAHIHNLHLRGHGIGHVRQEQFDFLSGFLGGRRYYEEQHGHMNVQQMHEHVPISTKDAEDWLTCMDVAIEKCGQSGPQIEKLRSAFRRVAMVLVNDLQRD